MSRYKNIVKHCKILIRSRAQSKSKKEKKKKKKIVSFVSNDDVFT